MMLITCVVFMKSHNFSTKTTVCFIVEKLSTILSTLKFVENRGKPINIHADTGFFNTLIVDKIFYHILPVDFPLLQS